MESKEAKEIIRSFRLAFAVSAIVLAVGAVFYHVVEKLHWVDAVYFSVITLATVGYGDIAPTTTAGKIFTIFYVLIGIGIVATFVNLAVKRAVLRRQVRRDTKNKR